MARFKLNQAGWQALYSGPAIRRELEAMAARIEKRADSKATAAGHPGAEYTHITEQSRRGVKRAYGRVATNSAEAAGIERYKHILEKATNEEAG